ncbi:MAG: alanine dehydrogenase [Atribacterota bacterium]
MVIGVPREIKDHEYRVAMTPAGVMALSKKGHRVIIERGAGLGSGFSDHDFVRSGASIVEKRELFENAELVLKVKEPLPEELDFLRPNQILFTYLHLASNKALTEALVDSRIIGVAYETVEEHKRLVLLEPMSEVAGRASVLIGALLLSKFYGGEGVLISGVPGVPPAKVVILGGGTVGLNAAKLAAGLRSHVVIFEIDEERMRQLENILPPNVSFRKTSEYDLTEELTDCDLLIGAVLLPGAKTPKLVTKEMVATMRKGSVIVDVSIDQGGCVETSLPTTHEKPTYEMHGIIHYCVTNIPGIYPRTSTLALCQSTLPYVMKIATHGEEIFKIDRALAKGVNVYKGVLTNRAVAEAHHLPYQALEEVI